MRSKSARLGPNLALTINTITRIMVGTCHMGHIILVVLHYLCHYYCQDSHYQGSPNRYWDLYRSVTGMAWYNSLPYHVRVNHYFFKKMFELQLANGLLTLL